MNYHQTHTSLNDCTIVKSSFLQDTTLSLEARGFLAQILSIPGIETQNLPVMFELLGVKPCRARRILNELREHNYYHIEQLKDDCGRYTGFYKVFSDIPLYNIRELDRVPKRQDARRAVIEADRNTPEPDISGQINIFDL